MSLELIQVTTMHLDVNTVHEYDFGSIKEILIFNDHDYFRSDGIYKRSPGRVGRKAGDVSTRDRGIAVSRAKKTLRRVALHNGMSRMMTLTTRDNITDFEKLDKLFKKFVFRLRAKYPQFHYIGTRERQGRGAIHYHLLTNMYIPQKEAYPIWKSLVGHGTVDLRKKDGIKAIKYLIDYIGESIQEPFITKKGCNAKSYLCSQSLDREYKQSRKTIRFYVQCVKDSLAYQDYLSQLEEMLENASSIIFDKPFKFDFKGELRYGRSILIETG